MASFSGKAIVIIAAAAFAGGALAAEEPGMWKATELATSPSESIRLLKGKDRKQVGTLSAARVRALVEIKRKVEAQAGVAAELVIVEGDTPNAFSTPATKLGPVVGINLGMIGMVGDDVDAYAAILGHEYAHLTLKHRESRQGREGLRQAGSVILGLVLGAVGVPLSGEISSFATRAVSTVYSRDEERDADTTGLKYSAAAGYDPHGGVRIWERMAARGSQAVPLLSSHPASAERVENMRALATTLATARPAPAKIEEARPEPVRLDRSDEESAPALAPR